MIVRLIKFAFSLWLLSLAAFGLSRLAPGDPVLHLLPEGAIRVADGDPAAYDRAYREAARRLGRDRPPFYFSLTNAALPDTLYRIVRADQREALKTLALRNGNWEAVSDYATVLRAADARQLLTVGAAEDVERLLPETGPLRSAYERLEARATPGRVWWPRLYWHGLDNQYHNYLSGLFAGDMGTSYLDGRPVADKIAAALPWTVLINGLALFWVFVLAVPLGLYLADRSGTRRERIVTALLFLLFGIPSFWVATLLANFFTTPAYGMDWFPSMGVGDLREGAGLWETISTRAAHLFLPVLCLAYPSWAYVSRQMRVAAEAQLLQPYVLTARMKGLSRGKILWGHVFRNAAFPLVTIFGALLPALLAGSVLIERIFNLPGLGQLLYRSAISDDWPLVIGLVLINGVLTVVGLFLADVGYTLLDPRVKLGQSAGV